MELKILTPTKIEINHGQHKIISDQPKYADGKDEGMTPVDIFVSSIGACIGVFIANPLLRRKIELSKCKIRMNWEMKDNPRRVGNILVDIVIPQDVSQQDKDVILNAANSCVIHNTLHNPPAIEIKIVE